MFTLEIKGRAVAVIYADEDDARDLIDDEDFQEDLRSIKSNGSLVWNGSDALEIRPASDAEVDAAEGSGGDADDIGDDDEDDEDEDDEDDDGGLLVVFIVPLDEDGGTA